MRIALAMLALFLLVAAPARRAEAQGITYVPAGSRIRVASPTFTGTGFAAAASDSALTLTVARRTAAVAVPLGTIRSLQVRREREPEEGAATWALRGLVVGVAAYAISTQVWDYDERRPYAKGYTSLSRTGALILFVATPTALGAVWGWMHPGTRWQKIPTPPRLRVTL